MISAPPKGTLFVAATPLGNLQDMSDRLKQALADASLILAEDTRRSRILLTHLGLHKPLQSLHSHNEVAKTTGLVERLVAGESLLVLSDAGTPGVSDPGSHLVDAAHGAGVTVCPVAGPSALTAALSVSGFAGAKEGVLFVGFLPRHGTERAAALERLQKHGGIAVIFESPERLARTLQALAQDEPQRPVCLCRELTKMHEEVRRSTVGALCAEILQKPPKGEITFVLGPKAPPVADEVEAPPLTLPQSLEVAVKACLGAGVSAKDTAQALAAVFDVPRKTVYALAIAHKPARA